MKFKISSFLYLFLTLALSAENDPPIGSFGSHEVIWSRDVQNRDKEAKLKHDNDNLMQNYQKEKSNLETQLASIESDLAMARNMQLTPLQISKGEFEKTADFNLRYDKESGKRNNVLSLQIRELQEKRVRVKNTLAELTPPLSLSNSTETQNPIVSIFLIKSQMGIYNADSEKVNDFTPSSIQYNDTPVPRVFSVSGTISGIHLSPDIARQARSLSNENNLYVVFSAKPLFQSFSESYSVPRTAEAIEKDKQSAMKDRGLKVIGTAGLLIALSALFGQEQNLSSVNDAVMSSDSINSKENSVKTCDTYNAKVISLSWEGAPEPSVLMYYDQVSGKYKRLWKHTP